MVSQICIRSFEGADSDLIFYEGMDPDLFHQTLMVNTYDPDPVFGNISVDCSILY